ncbi:MAG: penicillin-binding protein 2 [Chloroflexota bacterium]
MLARTDSRARALVLLLVMTIVAGGVSTRLVWWHVFERDRLVSMALDQLAQNQQIPARRGEIRDANGELLATSVELQSVFATPPAVKDAGLAAALLSQVLEIPAAELRARLESDQPWVWLKRRVSLKTAETIRSLNLRGIGMLPETQRVYPVNGAADGTTLAAQVLGYVNVDGRGQYGVEGAEDAMLAGLPGSVTAQEDVVGRRIADSVYQLRDPVDGSDLTVTIDAGVQHLLEKAILEAYTRNHAVGATGLVMNVRTGAIVGLASYPAFDANAYQATDPARFTSPAVSRQYEPGSVMKAFTISAAIDAGAVTTTDKFVDEGTLQIGNIAIRNADRFNFPYGHGALTPGDVLKLSNNIGAAKIGLKLGRQKLYEAFRRFGFGAPTGVDIVGEASGTVWNPDGPNASGDLTAAQNAFGQGLSVTAVQLAAGYAAIANGGTLVTPHVVAGWTDRAGAYHPVEQPASERIMRESTSSTVLKLLTGAIDDGIAKGASVPGYSIAGKTGTAEIAGPVNVRVPNGVDARGHPTTKVEQRWRYIEGWIDSSFVGISPATNPQLVTIILIHRPRTWGRYVMAQRPEEVYAKMMPQLLDYLAIPPDRPLNPVARP